MECRKLTAKLRDAVPVCFMVDGREIKRYKNIEIPDELKRLEYQDFKFDVPMVGAITFKIAFAAGVLPDPMPEPRGLKSRTTATQEPADLPQAISARSADVVPQAQEKGQTAYTISEATQGDDLVSEEVPEGAEVDHETNVLAEKPSSMEITYQATGNHRKELVKAISQFTGLTATFQNAPTFAYAIGDYSVDKCGTLTGGNNAALVEFLAEQGFIAG